MTIGRVDAIRLVDYYGEVELAVDRTVPLPKDTIASIATAGPARRGATSSLSPGAAETDLARGRTASPTPSRR